MAVHTVTFQPSDKITNGFSAVLVVAVSTSPERRGITVMNYGLDGCSNKAGKTCFLPEFLLKSWRKIPFEWAPVGGDTEERFSWVAPSYTRLIREVRKVPTS